MNSKIIAESDFFKSLKDLKQNKEHHPEGDVYVHSLLAYEYMRKYTHDDIMLTAALLHDIGKYRTQGIKDNGKITYYNHDIVGADDAFNYLIHNGYNFVDSFKVYMLIRYHMMTLHYKNCKKEKLNNMKNNFLYHNIDMSDLYLLCRCDILASDNDFSDLNNFMQLMNK